jgi:hypothetical protein
MHEAGCHGSAQSGYFVAAQEEALQKVTDFMGCSRSVARTLLMHFRWNSDVLFGAAALHARTLLIWSHVHVNARRHCMPGFYWARVMCM